ncbi:RNA recognition motif domain-containing protein [Bdellovibrio bacteriovorus]|uniref:RNA recognition motif domain-containing protein n=1 Tax=Bdellovibrio bacteriovorus TaxID=959 RepID=UPI0035A6C5A7
MGKKIYVGNLSFNVDQDQLNDVFAEFGTVDSVNMITDRETGRSKGFAFVEMSTDTEARAAIEKLNGMELAGRAMNISEAKPQEPRSGGGPRRNGGGFGGGSRRSY